MLHVQRDKNAGCFAAPRAESRLGAAIQILSRTMQLPLAYKARNVGKKQRIYLRVIELHSRHLFDTYAKK